MTNEQLDGGDVVERLRGRAGAAEADAERLVKQKEPGA